MAKIRRNISVGHWVDKKTREFAERHGKDFSSIVESALEEYLEKRDAFTWITDERSVQMKAPEKEDPKG